MNTARTYSPWDFRNWKISTKLVVIGLILALPPLIASTYIMAQRSANALSEQMQLNLSRLDSNMSRTFQQQVFDYEFDNLRLIAENEHVRAALVPTADQDKAATDDEISKLLNQIYGDPVIETIAVLDTKGTVLYTDEDSELDPNQSNSAYIKPALDGKDYISQPYFMPKGTEPSIEIARPIRESDDENSKIIGIVWERFNLFTLDFLLQDTLSLQTSNVNDTQKSVMSIFVVTDKGLVINHSDAASPMKYRLLSADDSVIKQYAQPNALGAVCPADKPDCEEGERTTRTLQSAPALQTLRDQLHSAWDKAEVVTARYCEPRQLTAAPVANPQSCDGAWKLIAYQTFKPTQTDTPLFSIVTEMDEATLLASVEEQRQSGLIIMLLIAPITVLASLFMARTMARPINKLAGVAHDIEKDTRHFHPEDIEALTKQGDEIGNLARVFSGMILALNARLDELRTIYEIGQTISSSVELRQTLEYILTSIQSAIRYDWAEICMYNAENNKMLIEVAADFDSVEKVDVAPYDAKQGYIGRLVEQQHGLMVPDMQAFTETQPETGRSWQHINPQSYLGVPLKFKDKVIGTIELVSSKPNSFTTDNLRILESIAAQAAIAVQNAQEVIARESKLKQEIYDLKIEIDQRKKTRDVSEITQSEYFQDLQSKVKTMKLRKPKPGELEKK